jgi:hypothetical protein
MPDPDLLHNPKGKLEPPNKEALKRALNSPAAWNAGGDTSQFAPRIISEGDTTYLSEHGNRRQLTGDEIGRASQYVNDFWQANPTGWQAEGDQALERQAATYTAPTVQYVAGTPYLFENNNYRRLQPNELADAQAYVAARGGGPAPRAPNAPSTGGTSRPGSGGYE